MSKNDEQYPKGVIDHNYLFSRHDIIFRHMFSEKEVRKGVLREHFYNILAIIFF